jgi:hypothetical protein
MWLSVSGHIADKFTDGTRRYMMRHQKNKKTFNKH